MDVSPAVIREGARQGAPPRMEDVAHCPICGEDRLSPLFDLPDRWLGVPGSFSYKRCVGCLTVLQAPRVAAEDIPLCYPKTYYTHSEASSQPRRPLAGLRDRLRADVVRAALWSNAPRSILGSLLAHSRVVRERALALLDELRPPKRGAGRALDVGCGSGELLAALGAAGWAAEGVDMDAAAAHLAHRRTGLPVQAGDFRFLPLPAASFSLVVLNHVFEHLSDPVVTLRSLSRLLEPSGRLVLVFPNSAGMGFKSFGRDWFDLDPPRHLVLPPPRGLYIAAERAGMRVARLRTTARAAAMGSARARACRAGRAAVIGDVRPTASDRLFASCEVAFELLRRPAGEEIVAVLENERRLEGAQAA